MVSESDFLSQKHDRMKARRLNLRAGFALRPISKALEVRQTARLVDEFSQVPSQGEDRASIPLGGRSTFIRAGNVSGRLVQAHGSAWLVLVDRAIAMHHFPASRRAQGRRNGIEEAGNIYGRFGRR